MLLSLQQLLQATDRLLLLDGPLGTRLAEKGFPVDRPGWSARALWEAPELVTEIHQEYWQAGSRCLTANTFRLHPLNLKQSGQAGKSAEFIGLAIDLAREVVQDQGYVLGSLAPVGDCYSPAQTPVSSLLEDSHFYLCEQFQRHGVDAVLLETHVSLREILIATRAAEQAGLLCLISVNSFDGQHLLDGSPLKTLMNQLEDCQPLAMGVNCLPVELVQVALDQMTSMRALPCIVYANAGRMLDMGEWEPTAGADPEKHAELAEGWLRTGIRFLGGCCGTGPDLIAKFSSRFADRLQG